MYSETKVLVLGGNGFIGRHAVSALTKLGALVTVGSRYPASPETPAVLCVRLEKSLDPGDWAEVASKYDVILNCVGILRQRLNESYESVHHLAPRALSLACSKTSTRFVHVTALGLSPHAKSRFLTSKFRGEQAVMAADCDWIIARPSLLDGDRGFGAEWLRGVARLPIFAVPMSAKGKIAAMSVEDAGEALAKLCLEDDVRLDLNRSRIFELGGNDHLGFEEYIRSLRRRYSLRRALKIPVPSVLARLGAHLCDLLHFSPFSFGHWELLCKDNIPSNNRLPGLLGRAPTKVVQSEE